MSPSPCAPDPGTPAPSPAPHPPGTGRSGQQHWFGAPLAAPHHATPAGRKAIANQVRATLGTSDSSCRITRTHPAHHAESTVPSAALGDGKPAKELVDHAELTRRLATVLRRSCVAIAGFLAWRHPVSGACWERQDPRCTLFRCLRAGLCRGGRVRSDVDFVAWAARPARHDYSPRPRRGRPSLVPTARTVFVHCGLWQGNTLWSKSLAAHRRIGIRSQSTRTRLSPIRCRTRSMRAVWSISSNE
jgi:hypothetical protein